MDLQLQSAYGPFINNEALVPDGACFDATNAATGELLAVIGRSGAKEIDAAVRSAQAAFAGWRSLGLEGRSRLLLKLADAIESDAERLARIDACDIGRRLAETRIDYVIAVRHLRYFAAVIVAHEDFGRPIDGGYLMAKREPLGVCGQIIPWNGPAVMVAMKLGPALAAGNTVVLKPDEKASLSTLEIARHIAAILPPGVVNIVPGLGEEAGAALTAHPGVRKLAFTGSTEVGKLVGAVAAARLVPATLELGGKSPTIVFPDIEHMDDVVDNVTFGIAFANGQACFAGSRLFLHADIYDAFLNKLKASFARMKVGAPFDETSSVSCLVSPEQGQRVLNYIALGIAEGARVVTGGQRADVQGNGYGYFVEPTILEVSNQMRVAREEIFGPVLCLIKWNDYDAMLAQANDSPYGLAAGVYTSSLHHAMDAADRLQTGSVWINKYFNLADGSPYGGTVTVAWAASSAERRCMRIRSSKRSPFRPEPTRPGSCRAEMLREFRIPNTHKP